VLVAVSGGVDSMVLLHLLHDLAGTHRWRLTVAHFNHRLRGRSSAADENLVRRVTDELNLPIKVGHAEVRSYARASGLSLEMAAREQRHMFLARAAVDGGIRKVALAHHADDQLELFFLRLFRGSGGQGLAGMKWRGPSPSNPRIELVRPLLEQPKSALEEYGRRAGIRFRHDASNACLDIQRNRIRHELLPLLRKKYQPALDKVIFRVMDILGAEAKFAGQMASNWLRRHKPGRARVDKSPTGLRALSPATSFIGVPFEQLPVAVQRRCLQIQLVEMGLSTDYEVIERLRQLPGTPVCPAYAGQNPAKLARQKLLSPTGRAAASQIEPRVTTVFRDSSGRLHRQHAAEAGFRPGAVEADLTWKRGAVVFEGGRLQWRICASHLLTKGNRSLEEEVFDADQVGSRVVLRHWQPGDRFQPIGLFKAVKLQDFFTNQKVPRLRRRELVLGVTAAGEIFWVEGMRISERFKLTQSTTRGLHWRWRRP
jgi:tRNA(Ile)-lysidine synthase